MLYIASDHGGYNLKSALTAYLEQNNLQYEDLGPYQLDPEDDYVDYVLRLVEKIRSNENSKGILICRNGVGVNILANKFKGVRAALSYDPLHAKSTRTDDNANVLTLPADYLEFPEAIEIIDAWLNTSFSNEERHVRRLKSNDLYGQE